MSQLRHDLSKAGWALRGVLLCPMWLFPARANHADFSGEASWAGDGRCSGRGGFGRSTRRDSRRPHWAISGKRQVEVQTVHAIWDWLVSWGTVGICILAVVALCLRCGFPLKHRNLPSFDSILHSLIGTISGVSGIKLLLNIRSINVAGDLYIAIIIGGFASVWAGLHGLLSGFKRAISESPLPPPKKEGGEAASLDSSISNDS